MWTRWGRVGLDGNSKRISCGTEVNLANQFNKKVSLKKNHRYKEIALAHESESKVKPKFKKQKTIRKKHSKLPKQVQDLLRFIFDMKMIEKSIVKVGYNVKKMPLGNLSKETIKEGFEVLKKIEKELGKKKVNNSKLSSLSGDFYTIIPHDFGFKKLRNFIISDKDTLKEKLELVESLRDIRVTAEIVNQVDEDTDDANELDAKYKKMK